MSSTIRVLIVDDSAVVRQAFKRILESVPDITVIGVAADPIFAIKKMQEVKPDVITLDVEMPRMDGLSFLRKIMSQQPTPVVVISSFTPKDSHMAIRAYEYGAVEVLLKPDLSTPQKEIEARSIIDVIRAAASAKVIRKTHAPEPIVQPQVVPKYTADAVIPKIKMPLENIHTDTVITIGASTGGTEAIRILLEAMPVNCPGIVIVQHMPEVFTRSFADRLNQLCKIHVKEAENGEMISRSKALIAPGNRHLLLKKRGTQYVVELNDGPAVNRHRPSVDVLFRSVAQSAGKNAVGVILTGMGNDGAEGMLEMKNTGAYTIAQDEKSSIVWGMPKEAINLNAALSVLPLDQIAHFINEKFR